MLAFAAHLTAVWPAKELVKSQVLYDSFHSWLAAQQAQGRFSAVERVGSLIAFMRRFLDDAMLRPHAEEHHTRTAAAYAINVTEWQESLDDAGVDIPAMPARLSSRAPTSAAAAAAFDEYAMNMPLAPKDRAFLKAMEEDIRAGKLTWSAPRRTTNIRARKELEREYCTHVANMERLASEAAAAAAIAAETERHDARIQALQVGHQAGG